MTRDAVEYHGHRRRRPATRRREPMSAPRSPRRRPTRRSGSPGAGWSASEWIKFRSLRSTADHAGRRGGRRWSVWASAGLADAVGLPSPRPPGPGAGGPSALRPARRQPRAGSTSPSWPSACSGVLAGGRRVLHRHDPRRRWPPCRGACRCSCGKIAVLAGGLAGRRSRADRAASPSSAGRPSLGDGAGSPLGDAGVPRAGARRGRSTWPASACSAWRWARCCATRPGR